MSMELISTLVMLTMEKRAEIGILKTIGSTPGSVINIFVRKGLAIALRGVLAGWLLALAASWIQNKFGLISLPPDIYFISYLPIETHILDYIIVGLVTFAICFVAALFPAVQASRVSVVEVLRR